MADVDPLERAEQNARKTRAALEQNGRVFAPLADAIADAVRRGGRLLLAGERRLHLLAEHAAGEIIGRRHGSGVQLPAGVLDMTLGDPQAIARRIGPFDAVLAVAGDCEDALFTGTLEAARARGAKVIAVCVGRARLERRADLAVDIPEQRPHHVPGLVAIVLHYLSKLALARLAANPLVRPARLDDGPRRATPPRDSSRHGAVPKSPVPQELMPAASVLPLLDAEDEASATIEIPKEELKVDFFEGVAESAREAREGARDATGHLLPVAETPEVLLICFRCKQCKNGLHAPAGESGSRARCPFCARKVKVPRASGRLFPRKDDAPGTPVLPLEPAGPRTVAALSPTVVELEVDPDPEDDGPSMPPLAAEPEIPAGVMAKADSGEILALALEAVSQPPRPLSLRFRLNECRLELQPEGGGAPRGGRVADMTAEGLEVSIGAGDAPLFQKGQKVVIRLETPAFLEPLIAETTVEQLHTESASGGKRDSVRILLPLEHNVPREAREKLARLAELADNTTTAEKQAV